MSEITNPNFCNFVKDINLYIQETQQTLREINVKKKPCPDSLKLKYWKSKINKMSWNEPEENCLIYWGPQF